MLKRVEDIPASLRAVLPIHAQKIYMVAFNEAEAGGSLAGAPDAAMSAVSKQYKPGADGKWGLREGGGERETSGLREASVIPTAPNEAGVSEGSVLLAAGVNKSRSREYTPEFIQAHLSRLEGAFSYADHPSVSEARERPERSLTRLAATVQDVRWDDAQKAALGDIHYLTNATGRDIMEAFRNEAVRANAGLSIYWPGPVKMKRRKIGESFVDVPLALLGEGTFDVDFVTRPNAGGRVAPLREGDDEMAELKELTFEMLQAERPDLLEAARAGLVPKLEEKPEIKPEPKPEEKPSLSEADRARMENLEKRLRQSDAREIVSAKLAESNLPTEAQDMIRADLAEAECADSKAFGLVVDGKVAQVKKLAESLAKPVKVTGAGAREDKSEFDIEAKLAECGAGIVPEKKDDEKKS